MAKIADFGISKIRTKLENTQRYAYEGIQGATIRFAPPEFFDDEKLRRPSDVWSFGMLAYQVLSGGREPYADLVSKAAVMRAIFTGKRPPRPEGVDDGVWEVVEACWKEEPEDRPSFAAIATALQNFT